MDKELADEREEEEWPAEAVAFENMGWLMSSGAPCEMELEDLTEVRVSVLPKCDFCDAQAVYDAKTVIGPWANLCEEHFKEYSPDESLGTGKGQRLVTKE